MSNNIAAIQEIVAEAHGLTVAHLTGPSRLREFTHPRQMAMVIARNITKRSLPVIGRAFNRDHTTVIHAQVAVEKRLAGCERSRDMFAALSSRCAEEEERCARDCGTPVFIRHGSSPYQFKSRRGGK